MSQDYYSEMIDQMYEQDSSVDFHEMEISRFTANLATINLHMIDAIAARFKTTRASIVEDVLSHAVHSMFRSLNENDRDDLSKQCDEQFIHKIKEHTQVSADYPHPHIGHWSRINEHVKKTQKDMSNA